jgi:hypothetical protein
MSFIKNLSSERFYDPGGWGGSQEQGILETRKYFVVIDKSICDTST